MDVGFGISAQDTANSVYDSAISIANVPEGQAIKQETLVKFRRQTGSLCKHLCATKPQPSGVIIICTLRSRGGAEHVRIT